MSQGRGAPSSSALAQRLRSAARHLLDVIPPAEPDVCQDASVLLDALTRSVRQRPSPDRVWLLLVAVSGSLPTDAEVTEARRALELRDTLESTVWLLRTGMELAEAGETGGRELRIVAGGVLADVQFTARNDLHTGIQRVVRHTLPVWRRSRDVLPVVWNSARTSLQGLTDAEAERVLNWGADSRDAGQRHGSGQGRAADDADLGPVIVPWRSVVVLPEVPMPAVNDRLTAIARSSGNELAVIGYDCIPIVSADLMPDGESEKFVHYLSVIKHARRICAISESSAAEFAGFADMLATQGLRRPEVSSCLLPVEPPTTTGADETAAAPAVPSILCVGSFEPRKNQLGLLHAAEVLWREGLDFELVLIGGSGWGRDIPARIRALRGKRRRITVRRRVTDEQLQAAYRAARFTVFASLHEGYGLPVAESLAAGAPAITTRYGSTAEIARGGGVLLVDPRDDQTLVTAMRDLLTDDALLRRLTDEIAARRPRGWQDYADELWHALVTGAPGRHACLPTAEGVAS